MPYDAIAVHFVCFLFDITWEMCVCNSETSSMGNRTGFYFKLVIKGVFVKI